MSISMLLLLFINFNIETIPFTSQDLFICPHVHNKKCLLLIIIPFLSMFWPKYFEIHQCVRECIRLRVIRSLQFLPLPPPPSSPFESRHRVAKEHKRGICKQLTIAYKCTKYPLQNHSLYIFPIFSTTQNCFKIQIEI